MANTSSKPPFQTLYRLGQAISRAFQKANCNQDALPKIAAEELQSIDTTWSFDPAEIANFLLNSSIPQTPGSQFSDLPLTVYQDRDFYVQILTWSQSTTAIHQHGFSGAFRVLAGSSIHSIYNFNAEFELGPDLAVGQIHALGSEYLPRGSIREISPGSNGLIHSLYHLDEPSLTVVVRTFAHEAYLPQLRLIRPGLMMKTDRLRNDSLVRMLSKLLHITQRLHPEQIAAIWLTKIATLDFPRLSQLYLDNRNQLGKTEEAFFNLIRNHHGHYVEALQDAGKFSNRINRISQTRKISSDPEQRFLLALLMNATDRQSILRMVNARFPGQDAVRLVADWLLRLRRPQADFGRRLKEALGRIDETAYSLGKALGANMPDDMDEQQLINLFKTSLTSTDPGHDTEGSDHHQQGPTSKVFRSFFDQLKQVEELEPLFR